MPVVVVPALCTMLGIGAELGLIGVLAVILSDGGTFTRVIAGSLIAAVALITLYYSFNTIRELSMLLNDLIRGVHAGWEDKLRQAEAAMNGIAAEIGGLAGKTSGR
jgi:hypothetical protein